MAYTKEENDWLSSYQEAFNEGDEQSLLRYLQLAPKKSKNSSDAFHDAFLKHLNNYFDAYISSRYKDPKQNADAYKSLLARTRLGAADPLTVRQADVANPMPKTIAEAVKDSSKKEIKPTSAQPAAQPTAAPVKAAQGQPQIQQKSIAEQMREDMAKRGQATASDFDKSILSATNAAWNSAYPKEQIGSQEAALSALSRIRGNAMAGNRVGQYQENGKTQYYSLDDPRIRQNIYDELKFGKDATWVGNNPFTGEYMDPDGNKWDSVDAYKQSGMARYDMLGRTQGEISMPQNDVLTPQQRVDSADYVRLAKQREEDARRYALANNADWIRRIQDAEMRKRVAEGPQFGAIYGSTSMHPVEPTMTAEDYVKQGNDMLEANKNSQLPAAYRQGRSRFGPVNQPQQGRIDANILSAINPHPAADAIRSSMGAIDAANSTWSNPTLFGDTHNPIPNASPFGINNLLGRMPNARNSWTPRAGGYQNGRWVSPAD